MSIHTYAFPILEYDDEKDGVILANRHGTVLLPEICVITFFREVLEAFVTKHKSEIRYNYKSEMANFPIYVVEYKGIELCLIQAVIGSASIAMMTDYLISYGIKNIIACGGCGVLVDSAAEENGYIQNSEVHLEIEYHCHAEYSKPPHTNYAYIPICAV